MSFKEFLFGGTDASAQNEQIAANRRAQDFFENEARRTRGQSRSLFNRGQRARRRGFQRSLDVLGESVPQQVGAFQEGNVGAQDTLLAGLPQIQSAILGAPIDLSGLRSRQVQFDPSFTQQRLPGRVQKKPTGFQSSGSLIGDIIKQLQGGR